MSEVKVLVDLCGEDCVVYGNQEGKAFVKTIDGTTGSNIIVDPMIVTEAEKEALFTSEDVENEESNN